MDFYEIQTNPQCTIPSLIDDELILTESRAMMIYLVEKYATNDSLYPNDVQTRAIIHDRLFFDVTNVYRRIADHYYPAMADDLPPVAENVPYLEEGVHALNVFLGQYRMAASNSHYTIADISLLSTVALLEVVNFDLSRYANITRWYTGIKRWARRNDLLLILDADMERFRLSFSTRV